MTSAHVLHRWVAAIVGLIVVASRSSPGGPSATHPTLVRLAVGAAVLFPIQVARRRAAGPDRARRLDADAAPRARRGHLGAAGRPRRRRATTRPASAPAPAGSLAQGGARRGRRRGPRTRRHRPRLRRADQAADHRAAARHDGARRWSSRRARCPGIQLARLGAGSCVWTLVGGTLAAGSANAINCYLDRDIDVLMTRTRRRPLPAHEVEPERAVVFGLVLGVVSFVVMAWFVNLLAAFLTLLAIAFYVVVYTMLLKRTDAPEHRHRRRRRRAAAGHRLGGGDRRRRACPALLLFALVFYWTPPHFWALSLRIRKDYAAAGVPMLPVVQRRPRDDPPDRALHDPHGRDLAGPLRGRADGPDLPRRGGRARRAVPVAGVRLWRRGASEEARPPARSGSTSTRSPTCRCSSSRSRSTRSS